MKKLWNLFWKMYHQYESQILYLIFGGLTTLVNWIVFFILNGHFGMHELIANTYAWVTAVLFAFFTNRTLVFHSATKGAGAFLLQMISFFGGRLLTYFLEQGVLFLFITLPKQEDRIIVVLAKAVAAVLVIITNYIISKWLIFRKGK